MMIITIIISIIIIMIKRNIQLMTCILNKTKQMP